MKAFPLSLHRNLLARISRQMSSRGAGSVGGSKARADFPAGLGEYTLSKGKSSAPPLPSAMTSRSRQAGEKCGLATLAAGLVLLVSCTTVPDSGRKQLNVVSDEAASRMGLTQFQKIKQSKKISSNSSYRAAARRVGARVSKVIPLPSAKWEFVVFDDPVPNAFALPGGKVGIHSGLFQITKNDAGLAAVMGHEIAHVYARHGGERMTTQIGVAVGTIILDQVLRNNTSDSTRRAVVGGTAAASTLGVLSFSRKQETEADQLGALYMARAGYDPRQSVEVWKRFAAYKAKKGGAQLPGWLRTHPLDSTRIRNLEAFMPRAMSEYKR